MNKELEKARAEGVKAAKKSTAKKLEAGPPANVLQPADCAKKLPEKRNLPGMQVKM